MTRVFGYVGGPFDWEYRTEADNTPVQYPAFPCGDEHVAGHYIWNGDAYHWLEAIEEPAWP